VRWPISAGEPDDSGLDGHRFRALHGFPLARLVRGFDFAISAAGYNSFHELTAYGVPAIFVPNQNPMMDEQEARALYADRQGIGLMARAGDLSRLSWALEAMGEPQRRAAMRERMARFPTHAGAQHAASFLAMLALSINASGDGPRIPSLQARW
jgi:UDP-N-acetylglucosamine:LPS N-acetylglucosamine transferase